MIYLPIEVQNALHTFHHVIFCLSVPLNMISMFCLIKETPPHQAKIRNYLLMTQVLVIVNGFYTDIMFEPIPLLPALCGFCPGLLCQAGLPPHSCLGILLVSYACLGISIFFCVFVRHQTLLPEESKLNQVKSYMILGPCFVTASAPQTVYALIPFDMGIVRNLSIASPYRLEWAVDRGVPFFMHERNPIMLFFLSSADFHSRSRSTILKIRRSLGKLFAQLMIPLFMLLIPGIVIISGAIFEITSFQVSIALMEFMALHPIAHNLILLGNTPSYRGFIAAALRKALPQRRTSEADSGAIRLEQRRSTISQPHQRPIGVEYY